MTWWDFLTDFIHCLNQILSIDLFSVNIGDGVPTVYISLGTLLCSILIVSAFLFYFIPRK